MFGKKKKTPDIVYDPETQTPVIRSSICTGESVGCLKDKKTGALQEIMLIAVTILYCFQKSKGG